MSDRVAVGSPSAHGSVVMVTPSFRVASGGCDSHTSALTRELARQGVRVIVLTAQRGIAHTGVERHGDCWVVTFPAWSIGSVSVSPRLVSAAIRCRRTDHVMHVHGYDATTALALLGRSTPTVFTLHDDRRQEPARSPRLRLALQRSLMKRLVTRCAAVICLSEADRRTLVNDYSVSPLRISLIPNGIGVLAIRRAEPFPGEAATVLCAGGLESHARVDDVIRAFAGVSAPVQLVVVGDGSQRVALSALVAGLGLRDRVRLVGNVSDHELHRWMRTARVFVSMSRCEPFAVVPVEAACAGARVILSDIPAHREVADAILRRCGTVLTDESTEAIAGEIRRQLVAPPTGRCSAPDWRDVAGQTIDVYRSVGADLDASTTANGHRDLTESLLQERLGK